MSEYVYNILIFLVTKASVILLWLGLRFVAYSCSNHWSNCRERIQCIGQRYLFCRRTSCPDGDLEKDLGQHAGADCERTKRGGVEEPREWIPHLDVHCGQRGRIGFRQRDFYRCVLRCFQRLLTVLFDMHISGTTTVTFALYPPQHRTVAPKRIWKWGVSASLELIYRFPPFFGSTTTVSRWYERLRGGQYSLFSFCLLFSAPPAWIAICKSGGTCPPLVPYPSSCPMESLPLTQDNLLWMLGTGNVLKGLMATVE